MTLLDMSLKKSEIKDKISVGMDLYHKQQMKKREEASKLRHQQAANDAAREA
jgi:hypothetical protein